MKKIISLLFALAICINIYAQDGGIEFTHGNWETVLATAKEQNKIIFVDAYASWCGPCKVMDKKVFTQKSVGDLYNTTFINAKIDMEKGEGPMLSKKYGVRAYPTFLFINSDGELVHKGVGGQSPEDFIKLGKAANDPTKQLVLLKKKYEGGERDSKFLLNYINALSAANSDATKPTAEYLASQDNPTSAENMELIFKTTRSIESKGFEIMKDNKEAFYAKYGKERIQGLMDYCIQKSHRGNLEKMTECYNTVFPAESQRMIARYSVQHYMYDKSEGADEKFEDAALLYMKKYDTENSNELNAISWHVYEVSTSRKILKKAAKWAKKSVELDSNYANNDTLAALYYKLKKKKKAIKYAKASIELAKKGGMDASETEALLKKIEAL